MNKGLYSFVEDDELFVATLKLKPGLLYGILKNVESNSSLTSTII